MLTDDAVRSTVLREFETQDWYEEDRLVEFLLRGTSFNEILSDADPVRYRIHSWFSKYTQLEERVTQLIAKREHLIGGEDTLVPPFDGPLELSVRLLSVFAPGQKILYRLRGICDEVTVFRNWQFQKMEVPVMDVLSKGLPSLRLPRILENPAVFKHPDWMEMDNIPQLLRSRPYSTQEEYDSYLKNTT